MAQLFICGQMYTLFMSILSFAFDSILSNCLKIAFNPTHLPQYLYCTLNFHFLLNLHTITHCLLNFINLEFVFLAFDIPQNCLFLIFDVVIFLLVLFEINYQILLNFKVLS